MQHNITPKKGCILVSKPLIDDGFFEQSIVYLTAHDSEGSLGFALNKKSSMIVQDFLDGFPGREPIYYGGPVDQDALFYLHSFENIPGALHVGNKLYLGGDFEIFKTHCIHHNLEEGAILKPKFFLGYSGWSDGQLVEELEHNTWLLVDSPNVHDPLSLSTNAWREYMKNKGGKYAIWANSPSDPMLN